MPTNCFQVTKFDLAVLLGNEASKGYSGRPQNEAQTYECQSSFSGFLWENQQRVFAERQLDHSVATHSRVNCAFNRKTLRFGGLLSIRKVMLFPIS